MQEKGGEAGCSPLPAVLLEGLPWPVALCGPIWLGAARGLPSPDRQGWVRGQCI